MYDNTQNVVQIAAKTRHLALLKKVKSGEPLKPREIKELEAFESLRNPEPEQDKDCIKTQREAAAYSGVSERTIREWEKKEQLRDAKGNFIRELLDKHIVDRETDGSPLKIRQLSATADLTETKAALAKMQMQVKLGELLPREEVEQQRLDRVIETRRNLLALVRKMTVLFKLKPEDQIVMKREIFYCLEVFAGKREQTEWWDLFEFVWSNLSDEEKKQATKQIIPRSKSKK